MARKFYLSKNNSDIQGKGMHINITSPPIVSLLSSTLAFPLSNFGGHI